MTARTCLLAAWVGGCAIRVDYPAAKDELVDPDDDVIDTDIVDTDVVDTDTDAAPTGDTAPPCELAWWDGLDLPYRVLVDVTLDAPVGRAPIAVDLDLRAALDALGDPAPVAADSLRVVVQACTPSPPVLPAQLVDRLAHLDARVDHVDPADDEAGALVVLYDTDGDLGTVETPPGALLLGVYFAASPSTAPAPTWPTDLTLDAGSSWTLATTTTTATLDPDAGGLLSALRWRDGASLLDQTSPCCGNSMHFWGEDTWAGAPFGWITPQSGPATLEVLADGPLVAAVRATGARTGTVPGAATPWGTYAFEALWWMFAGRPEVWHVTHHVAVTDCTTEHHTEASYGFRPLQVNQRLGGAPDTTFVEDTAGRRGAVFRDDVGFAVGVHQPPAQLARVSNPGTATFGIHGNEQWPPGVLSPVTVPAGAPIFDHVGLVVLPFDGDWSRAQAELAGLMTPPRATLRPPERR